MATVRLSEFNGLNPRLKNTKQGYEYAQIAQNVDLSSGRLRPWRTPKEVASTQTHNGFFCDCKWVDVEPCESARQVYEHCDGVVISGKGRTPSIYNCGDNEQCNLKLDAPAGAPTVDAVTALTLDRAHSHRQYMYTYKTPYGESSGSLASIEATLADGEAAVVSGFKEPDNNCITHLLVYRLSTGYRSGTEEVQEMLTGYRLVAEVPVGTLSITDKLIDKDLGRAFEETYYNTAQDGLLMVSGFKSGGMVGYKGKNVYSSIPGEIHKWPAEAEQNYPESIQGIATLVDGCVVFGLDSLYYQRKYQMSDGCMQPLEVHDAPKAIINHDDRKVVRIGETIIYVSDEGLAQYSTGGVTLITTNFFDKEDWRKMKPETMRLGYSEGSLFFVTDTHSYVMDLKADIKTALTTITLQPERMIRSTTGHMIMLENNAVSSFDAGGSNLHAVWSVDIRTRSFRFRYANTHADGSFSLKINGVDNKIPAGERKCRIKNCRKTTKHSVTISTKSTVNQISLGSSSRDRPAGNY